MWFGRALAKSVPALSLLLVLALSGCGGGHRIDRDIYGAGPGGSYLIGNPYSVHGVWYYPAENPAYDEVGLASWYGEEFRGNSTANGERFDPRRLTAAHTTLPLPVLVRVTNLENGRQTVVRINDRGPFVPGRIIDLSRAAAEELGFAGQGVARVRVQYVGRADGKTPQLARARTEPKPSGYEKQEPLPDPGAVPGPSAEGPSDSDSAAY